MIQPNHARGAPVRRHQAPSAKTITIAFTRYILAIQNAISNRILASRCQEAIQRPVKHMAAIVCWAIVLIAQPHHRRLGRQWKLHALVTVITLPTIYALKKHRSKENAPIRYAHLSMQKANSNPQLAARRLQDAQKMAINALVRPHIQTVFAKKHLRRMVSTNDAVCVPTVLSNLAKSVTMALTTMLCQTQRRENRALVIARTNSSNVVW